MDINKYTTCVAGTVTLYNSDFHVLANINKYVNQVGRLYVVDNSEEPDKELISQLLTISSKIEYIKNDGNLGLGVALNRAADRAVNDGFSYLFMMDDDSSTTQETVKQLYATLTSNLQDKIGIVSAGQIDLSSKKASHKSVAISPTPVQTAITAGSLLSLAAYQQVGPFQEDLFVDWVDIEYSFRLKRYGYKLLLDHQAKIIHRIGIRKQVKLLGFIPYRWRSHNPTRLYYKFRNSLFVMKREGDNIPPDFRKRFHWELRRNIFKILIAEPNKWEFLTMIRKAIYDAREGRLGKMT